MPLNQQVKDGNGKSESSFKIGPTTMADFLEMTHTCQHGQDGLNEHPRVPLTTFAASEISWLPASFLKVNIAENDHLVSYPIDKRLESGAIVDVGGVTSPIDNQAKMIEQQAQF